MKPQMVHYLYDMFMDGEWLLLPARGGQFWWLPVCRLKNQSPAGTGYIGG